MAHFDKAIAPGGRGEITLKVNTKGYQGNLTKSAKVYTNDPASRVTTIKVKAFVSVPIHISSRSIFLYAQEGQSVTRFVLVKAELDKPLKLASASFDLSEKVTYAIEEIEKGRAFRIRFTSFAGPSQSYRGHLKLKTNYPEKPELTIWIAGRIQPKKR